MIDKNRIFQLFDDNGNEIRIANAKDINDFLSGPYAKIGMFTKLIQNHKVFHLKLEKFLKKEQPNYNVEGTKEASEFTVFNRAWTYIKNIDIDNEDHLQARINMEKKVFYTSLQSAIEYFQIEEEYEKCAHLFNIQKLVKEI